VRVIQFLDLILLALALPLFLVAGWPLAGWAAGAGAYVVQRGLQLFLERRAAATDDTRAKVGYLAGGLVGRGWLVALTIFGVGVGVSDEAGLSAAVLFLAVFTVQFTFSLILRPDPTR
jgi:hypothetical protein